MNVSSESKPMPRSANPWIAFAVVLAMLVLGTILRINIAQNDNVWLDELHTGWVVKDSISQIWPRATIGNQTPLYFYATHVAASLIGFDEFGLRFISLFSSFIVIAIGSWTVWKGTKQTGPVLLAGFIFAFGFDFVYQGTEARPYALLQALSLFQVLMLWRFLQQDSNLGMRRVNWNAALLVISTSALAYTHITSGLLLVAELAFLVLWLFKNRDSWQLIVSRIAIVFVATLLVCIPLFPAVSAVFDRRDNWITVSSIERLLQAAWPVVFCMFALPTIGWALGTWNSNDQGTLGQPQNGRERHWFILLVAIWALIPIAGLFVAESFGIPLALWRYAQVGVVGLPIFAGLTIGLIDKRLLQWVSIAVIFAATCWLDPSLNCFVIDQSVPRFRSEDWKSPIAEINQADSKRSQPVFLFSNLVEDVDAFANGSPEFQDYLRFPVKSLFEVDESQREIFARPTLGNPQQATAQFRLDDIELIKKQEGCWILVRGHPELMMEKSDQVRSLLNQATKLPAESIKIRVFETPGSFVYLLSVDL